MQLQGEERTSEMMMKALEKQASLQQVEAEKNASMHKVDNPEANLDDAKLMEEEKALEETLKELQREVLLEKADAGSSDNVHQSDKSHINLQPASTTTSKWGWGYVILNHWRFLIFGFEIYFSCAAEMLIILGEFKLTKAGLGHICSLFVLLILFNKIFIFWGVIKLC